MKRLGEILIKQIFMIVGTGKVIEKSFAKSAKKFAFQHNRRNEE